MATWPFLKFDMRHVCLVTRQGPENYSDFPNAGRVTKEAPYTVIVIITCSALSRNLYRVTRIETGYLYCLFITENTTKLVSVKLCLPGW